MKKNFKKLIAAASATFFASLCLAQAETPLFVFDFTTAPDPAAIDGIESISSWSSGSIGGGSLSFSVPKEGSASTSFSFTVAEGFVLDLTGVSFRAKAANNQGSVKLSGSLPSGESFGDNSNLGTSFTSFDLDSLVSLSGGQSGSFGVTGSSNKANTVLLDDVSLFGTISAVPEPATLAAIVPALFVGAYFARKRKQGKTA